MCDKYIDIGGVMIPQSGPLGLISDGAHWLCAAPGMIYPRAVSATVFRDLLNARNGSNLDSYQRVSFSQALDLLKCGARLRWHDWEADRFVATNLSANPDERGVLLYEAIDQSSEDFRVQDASWRPSDTQMLWDGWMLHPTQKRGYRFYL